MGCAYKEQTSDGMFSWTCCGALRVWRLQGRYPLGIGGKYLDPAIGTYNEFTRRISVLTATRCSCTGHEKHVTCGRRRFEIISLQPHWFGRTSHCRATIREHTDSGGEFAPSIRWVIRQIIAIFSCGWSMRLAGAFCDPSNDSGSSRFVRTLAVTVDMMQRIGQREARFESLKLWPSRYKRSR